MAAVTIENFPASAPFALAVHGGAGPRSSPTTAEHRAGLARAVTAGGRVLAGGGSALDAVCAAVVVLEDDELFNAGHGAALTVAGTAELDACLVDGANGLAGAVAGVRFAANPVLAARAVMERTPHVLLVDPSAELLAGWGLATAAAEDFVTPARLRALRDRLGDPSAPAYPVPAERHDGGQAGATPSTTPPVLGHGTVGAVARDAAGRLAAATSTGGVTGQWVGRVGDTPLVGAGTWADRSVAVSGTGIGEFFVRGVLAHDLAARLRYTAVTLPEAVAGVLREHLVDSGGDGGLVAVDATGSVVLGYCSEHMYRARLGPDGPVVAD